jgi:hypothetical protein
VSIGVAHGVDEGERVATDGEAAATCVTRKKEWKQGRRRGRAYMPHLICIEA